MINPTTGNRELAYVSTVHDIAPIAGADWVVLIHVEGWTLIAKKNEFKEGDKHLFFEIDSKLSNEDPRFAFLANRGYKVKTMKLKKFDVYSEGLAFPLSEFPEVSMDARVHTFVTEKLGVTYYVPEDTARKREPKDAMVNSYKKKHSRFFSLPLVQHMMRYQWFRNSVLYQATKRNRKEYFPCQ